MNRTADAILMRKRNFDSLDSSAPGVAVGHFAKQTKEIWDEYEQNPDGIRAEGRRAYLNFKRQSGG